MVLLLKEGDEHSEIGLVGESRLLESVFKDIDHLWSSLFDFWPIETKMGIGQRL